MERQEPATLRITSPAEAAQLIPYLVGFTPEESLVISAIQTGRVEVTARVDLSAVQAFGAVEDLLDRIWSRFPDADGFAVAYTADHPGGWNLLQRCDGWLPNGCQTMLIDADTWHTPDGASGAIDPYGTISAQATYHGLPRLDRRADLESRFASPPDSDELDHQLGVALAELPSPNEKAKILTATRDLISRNLPAAARPEPDPQVKTAAGLTQSDAIRLSVLAQHPAARDLALLSIHSDNASKHLALWQGVVHGQRASATCPFRTPEPGRLGRIPEPGRSDLVTSESAGERWAATMTWRAIWMRAYLAARVDRVATLSRRLPGAPRFAPGCR